MLHSIKETLSVSEKQAVQKCNPQGHLLTPSMEVDLKVIVY